MFILLLFALPVFAETNDLDKLRNKNLWKMSCERVYLRTVLDRGLAKNLTTSTSKEFERRCNKEFEKSAKLENWQTTKPEFHACSVIIDMVHDEQTEDEPNLGTVSEMVSNYCTDKHVDVAQKIVAERPAPINIPKSEAKYGSVIEKIEKDEMD